MDIKYSKNTERPVAEIVKEQFSLAINKAAGEYDRNLTDIVLAEGDEYKVKHNGSEYICTAWAEDGKVHIGGKGEPFDIYNYNGDIYAMAQQDGHNKFEVYHEKMSGLPYDAMPAGYPGAKTEMVEIVPEQTLTLKEVPFAKANMVEILGTDGVKGVEGQSYTVVYNGITYELVASLDEEGGVIVLGSMDAMDNEQAEIPFCIAFQFPMSDTYRTAIFAYGETCELKITTKQEIVTPLDYEFMPAGYPKVETTVIGEFIPEQTVVLTEESGGIAEIPNFNFDILGESAEVTPTLIVDGQKMDLTHGGVSYGNSFFLAEDEGLVLIVHTSGELCLLQANNALYYGIHTIKVVLETRTITKMSTEFLPFFYIQLDGDYVCKTSMQEILEAYNNGCQIGIKINDTIIKTLNCSIDDEDETNISINVQGQDYYIGNDNGLSVFTFEVYNEGEHMHVWGTVHNTAPLTQEKEIQT